MKYLFGGCLVEQDFNQFRGEMRMKKMLIVGIVILAMVVLPAISFAGSPWASQSTYGEKTMGKLTYGMKNMLLGWTEIVRKPYEAVRDKKCVIKGMGYGLLNTVTYTIGGALHTVTFPIPQIDVPIPNDGVKF